MPQISILGCGWLGFPLAKKLFETGYAVKGSTTSPEKMERLENANIQPFQIVLSGTQTVGNVTDFLKDSEILIIDIPPQLRSADSQNFVSKIQSLLPFIEKSEIKNVLFISSTSVYGDTDSGIIDEDSPLRPETESGKQLRQVEEILRKNLHFQTTILRFGGLIGDDRHPVNHMSGKKNIENPCAPINLIHQKDCIAVMVSVLDKKAWNTTFNAVAPFHPTREEYYTKKAIELGLEVPQFNPDHTSKGKIISSQKLQNELNYTFQQLTDF